jgi:hypothetical protein
MSGAVFGRIAGRMQRRLRRGDGGASFPFHGKLTGISVDPVLAAGGLERD